MTTYYSGVTNPELMAQYNNLRDTPKAKDIEPGIVYHLVTRSQDADERTVCCHRDPHNIPHTERITMSEQAVTCKRYKKWSPFK